MLLGFLSIFSFFITASLRKIQIQIPSTNYQSTSLRLNSIQYIQRPSFQFSTIYKREVFNINVNDNINANGTQQELKNISICQQQKSIVNFKVVNSYIRKDRIINNNRVVYKFQQLKKSRRILDLLYDSYNKNIVTISNNGIIQSMRINNISGRIQNQFSVVINTNNDFEDLKPGKLIQIGLQKKYYFFNQETALFFDISYKKIQTYTLTGYNPCPRFQQVLVINSTIPILAIADRQKGVYFYSFQDNSNSNSNSNSKSKKLVLMNYITNMSFSFNDLVDSKLNIQDIQFNPMNNNLLVLDESNGIYFFQLSFQDKKVNYKLLSKNINKKGCNVMHLDIENQFLYLSCNQISKINLKQWPVYTEKLIPHPLINIKQIVTASNNLLALVGNNVFKLFYLDRPVDNFEDNMLDKLIFKDDLVITSNQNYITVLKYKITPPKIICQTNDPKYVGNNKILLKTFAQCNQTYLKSINYQVQLQKRNINISDIDISEDDICVYTTIQDLYIWQSWSVKTFQLKYILYGILGLIVITIIFYIVNRQRLKKLQIQLLGLDLDLSKNEPNPLVEQKVNQIINTYNQQQNKQEQYHNHYHYNAGDSQKNIVEGGQLP